MLLPALVLPLLFTSCDDDRDSNPTLDLSHVADEFVLNTPALAENNTYDLKSAKSLKLTCSQPNYGGIPYVVRYYVQVSIDPKFISDPTATHTELATSYKTAEMEVNASEVNDAVVALSRQLILTQVYLMKCQFISAFVQSLMSQQILTWARPIQMSLPCLLSRYLRGS